MIIIPKEKPVIENLNSYYLDIQKLFEHFQGELGSGAVHFKSPSSEGIIFFDKDDILEGIFQDRDGERGGSAAIEHLINLAAQNSFLISVYKIDPDKVYFWVSMRGAKRIYQDLSTEFTDLEGLIKKMASEKLTGYIVVSINNDRDGGLIFFNNGEIIGGSYSWSKGQLNGTKESQKLLIEKTKESGGVFHVSRISSSNGESESQTNEITAKTSSSNLIYALEDLLGMFEKTLSSNKKTKMDFHTLLKKKFMEKADKYAFLDPFAGEFEYADHKIKFQGDASDEDLVNGIMEAVEDLAGELGVLPILVDELAQWSQKYAKEVAKFGISF